MKPIIHILAFTLFLNTYGQTILKDSDVKLSDFKAGKELKINKKDGTKLKDGSYIIIASGKGKIIFELQNNTFKSPVQITNSSNRVGLELFLKENIVIELNAYKNYSDNSKNTGPLILEAKETFKNNIYCKTIYNEEGLITFKKCNKFNSKKRVDDIEYTYEFDCDIYSKEPENLYCIEKDNISKIHKLYKNHKLYREILLKDGESSKTINYDESNNIIEEIYESVDTIKTIKADKSYTIEIKENSSSSSVKKSTLISYDTDGKAITSEQREQEDQSDGTIILKRKQKDKTIIETYDNDGKLIESKEE